MLVENIRSFRIVASVLLLSIGLLLMVGGMLLSGLGFWYALGIVLIIAGSALGVFYSIGTSNTRIFAMLATTDYLSILHTGAVLALCLIFGIFWILKDFVAGSYGTGSVLGILLIIAGFAYVTWLNRKIYK